MRTTATIALLLLPAGLPGAAAEPPRLDVTLISPTSEEVLDGKAVLEAEVETSGEIAVLKVDFYVDGNRVGWRDDPPYRIEWDAGGSLRARQVRAVAYGNDGRTYESVVRTREIHVDYRERVSVVNVFATVRDFGGEYTGNLKPEEFRLFEDGIPQELSHFAYENLPLHVAFVLDTSLTMEGERIKTALEAAERFANSLDFSRDHALVITFAGKPELAAPLTADRREILGAIGRAETRSGGTALYDGIMMAVDVLRPIDGRKAIILLSDGRDESGDGFRPGSVHTFEETLRAAHQADVIVYTIGVGKGIEDQMDFYGVRTVGEILTRFAEETGGRPYFASRVSKLRKAYENVADALRHQYNLGYTPTNSRRDGSWREIQVHCEREGYEVNARKGYYASED